MAAELLKFTRAITLTYVKTGLIYLTFQPVQEKRIFIKTFQRIRWHSLILFSLESRHPASGSSALQTELTCYSHVDTVHKKNKNKTDQQTNKQKQLKARQGKPRFSSLFCKANLGNGCKMNHLTSKAPNKHFHFQGGKKRQQNQSCSFPWVHHKATLPLTVAISMFFPLNSSCKTILETFVPDYLSNVPILTQKLNLSKNLH